MAGVPDKSSRRCLIRSVQLTMPHAIEDAAIGEAWPARRPAGDGRTTPHSRRRRTMKRFWLTALALSACLTTSTFAEITGKVTYDGQAPERKPLAGVATD